MKKQKLVSNENLNLSSEMVSNENLNLRSDMVANDYLNLYSNMVSNDYLSLCTVSHLRYAPLIKCKITRKRNVIFLF